MTHIDDYCQQSGITRRWAEILIKKGKLPALKQNGKTYILTGNQNNSTQPEISQTISTKEFISQIKQKAESGSDIKALLKAVETFELQTGQKLKGCSYKTLWAIQSGKRSTERRERADKFTIKNTNLAKATDKILPLASYLYFKNAQPNLSLTCDLIQEYARHNEEFYEIAAIPKATLYSFISKSFRNSGHQLLHQFLNHYNLFSRDLPTVRGAFTSDIQFFDYIIGDDHKQDIASVLVWNESKKDFVKKQMKLWLWVEARTMYPLGWCIKVGDFTSTDLIQSLSPVLIKYGYPQKAVMVDNGIGRSAEFQNFLTQAGTQVEYSEAYKPTNKATGERSFGMIKNEHDVFFKNFVGPDKLRESRHSTNKLSPEDAIIFFDEAKKSLESYLLNFFIDRKRNRRINYKQVKISIKEYFETSLLTYEPRKANPMKIKTAACKTDVKVFKSKIIISRNQFVPADVIPLCFYNNKVTVKYNPADYSEVYIYAFRDTTDLSTGESFTKGDYIATLRNTDAVTNKQSEILTYNNKLKKAIKVAAENVKAIRDSQFPNTLPGQIGKSGEYYQQHKEELKQIEESLKNAIPLNEVPEQNTQPAIDETISKFDSKVDRFEFSFHLPEEKDFSDYPDINDIKIED